MGLRVVIVDDNPHLSFEGRVYPANATFQHFAAGLLDLEGAPVASITSCVPLREATSRPVTLPLDPRIRVVGTAPFDGIEGYLRALPRMLRANRPVLRAAIAAADLVWIKVPASNAVLAATLAWRAGVPRFVWVAGSARDVAAARYRGARRVAGMAIGVLYDAAGRLAAVGGDRVVVGREIVTSLVEEHELIDPAMRSYPRDPGVLRLAWAGRLVEGKGLEWLFGELAEIGPVLDGRRVELTLIGEGPARARLEALATSLGIADRVTFVGYIADRAPYLEALAAADVFVYPSEAEGFPKVVLDAMAVAVPVVARPAGMLVALMGGSIEPITLRDGSLASAIVRSMTSTRDRISGRVMAHTVSAERRRLVDRWMVALGQR